MKIFIYGTLLKGMSRCKMLADSQLVGHGLIQGVLYDLGYYPAVIKGNTSVYGELYEVDKEKISLLDSIEGYTPLNEKESLYVRKEVSVKLLNNGSYEKSYIYFYNRDLQDNKKINHGDYRRYIMEGISDKQWYIAYGSNMSSERLKARIGEVYEVKTGYLEGYKLIFNKTADKGGSYANIVYIGSDCQCPCVAYSITKEQLFSLDKHEGEPSHYIRIGLPFVDIAGKSYIGHVYIANPDKLILNQTPSSYYLEYIHTGYEENRFDKSNLPDLYYKLS